MNRRCKLWNVFFREDPRRTTPFEIPDGRHPFSSHSDSQLVGSTRRGGSWEALDDLGVWTGIQAFTTLVVLVGF